MAGVIAALVRTFQNRVADLVRQDKRLLERAIGGVSYQLFDDHKDYCRVVTDRFTVEFIWMGREQWIDALITVDERLNPSDHHCEYSAREWLEAQGLPTLPRRSGPKSSLLLRDELESVRQAVASVLCDERKIVEALYYREGRNEGYTDRVVVPEEAPPSLITAWTVERVRERAQCPQWVESGH